MTLVKKAINNWEAIVAEEKRQYRKDGWNVFKMLMLIVLVEMSLFVLAIKACS